MHDKSRCVLRVKKERVTHRCLLVPLEEKRVSWDGGCGPGASLDVGVQGCCAHERTSLSSKRCSLGLSSVLEGRDRPWEDGHQGGTAQPLLGFGQCRAKLQQRHHVATRRHSNQIKNLLLWRCVRVLVSFRARKSLQRGTASAVPQASVSPAVEIAPVQRGSHWPC